MFKNNYPLFNSGRILKTHMLEELRDFSRDFTDIKFKDYSNGIICGCEIEVTDDYIILGKGIIKYNHVIYILKEEELIRYEANNKMMLLKIKFLNEKITGDFRENSAELRLEENLELGISEMEICRFKLRVGAELRVEHVSFTDLSTAYDTINFINTPFAASKESSLSPMITQRFGKELMKCKLTDPWDISFAFMAMQSKTAIEKELITGYLINRLNIEDKKYTNEELYNYLLRVLNEAKENNDVKKNDGRGRYKKIMID